MPERAYKNKQQQVQKQIPFGNDKTKRGTNKALDKQSAGMT